MPPKVWKFDAITLLGTRNIEPEHSLDNTPSLNGPGFCCTIEAGKTGYSEI